MELIIQKFGGTSVADPQRISHVAAVVKRELDLGNQVAVVVSAMAGHTNTLANYVNDILADTVLATPEQDVVLSSGEQVTAGLTAIALEKVGIKARSFMGWQIPLHTDKQHTDARISEIGTDTLNKYLDEGTVPVVSGYQGVSMDNRVTTLGRGGSDTTAVAIAAALKASRCDIYTDVEGVFTADPRWVDDAQKLEHVTYEEMVEMAYQGAKVLHPRSVEMAMRYSVPLTVRSTFIDQPGTRVIAATPEALMESPTISGITHTDDAVQVTVFDFPDIPGKASSIFKPLMEAGIEVDMIVQNIKNFNVPATGSTTNMTFTIPQADVDKCQEVLQEAKAEIGFQSMVMNEAVCKVTVVGLGLQSRAGIAHTMFTTLSDRGINIDVISTSQVKISVLIPRDRVKEAVRSLHESFKLSE